MNKQKGALFVLSGSSGAGKSTVIKELFRQCENLYFSVSATTRTPRCGEADGVSYRFVSHDCFADMIKRGKLLEYVEYVGNFYGTPSEPVIEKLNAGVNVILELEVRGAMSVKEKMPDAVTVFITPPSFSELEKRLRGRNTESEEVIQGRLTTAQDEYRLMQSYDYIVINDDVQRAVTEIMSVICAEHCKTSRRIADIQVKL